MPSMMSSKKRAALTSLMESWSSSVDDLSFQFLRNTPSMSVTFFIIIGFIVSTAVPSEQATNFPTEFIFFGKFKQLVEPLDPT